MGSDYGGWVEEGTPKGEGEGTKRVAGRGGRVVKCGGNIRPIS